MILQPVFCVAVMKGVWVIVSFPFMCRCVQEAEGGRTDSQQAAQSSKEVRKKAALSSIPDI